MYREKLSPESKRPQRHCPDRNESSGSAGFYYGRPCGPIAGNVDTIGPGGWIAGEPDDRSPVAGAIPRYWQSGGSRIVFC